MSFKFQGYTITYNDVYNYFNDMKISRENHKKNIEKIKEKELKKYNETIEIIKNHSDFLLELNDKKLCKYGGNSSIVSVFRFKLSEFNKNKNNYELEFKDNGGIDEVSNLLSLVIENKYKKDSNYDYLNKKINYSIIISLIAIGTLLIIKR